MWIREHKIHRYDAPIGAGYAIIAAPSNKSVTEVFLSDSQLSGTSAVCHKTHTNTHTQMPHAYNNKEHEKRKPFIVTFKL